MLPITYHCRQRQFCHVLTVAVKRKHFDLSGRWKLMFDIPAHIGSVFFVKLLHIVVADVPESEDTYGQKP